MFTHKRMLFIALSFLFTIVLATCPSITSNKASAANNAGNMEIVLDLLNFPTFHPNRLIITNANNNIIFSTDKIAAIANGQYEVCINSPNPITDLSSTDLHACQFRFIDSEGIVKTLSNFQIANSSGNTALTFNGDSIPAVGYPVTVLYINLKNILTDNELPYIGAINISCSNDAPPFAGLIFMPNNINCNRIHDRNDAADVFEFFINGTATPDGNPTKLPLFKKFSLPNPQSTSGYTVIIESIHGEFSSKYVTFQNISMHSEPDGTYGLYLGCDAINVIENIHEGLSSQYIMFQNTAIH